MHPSQPDRSHAPPGQADSAEAQQSARQLWAAAEIAVSGVQQGKKPAQILMQLQQAGVGEQEAQGLVQYAQDVERLNTAGVVAGEGVRLGKPAAEIVNRLRQLGLDDVVAAGIENRVRQDHRQSQMRRGTGLMRAGCLWLAGAGLLWMLRAPMPSGQPAAWLLLAAGILQIVWGWRQKRKAKSI